MSEKFIITAVPAFRPATPGAKITYILDETLGGPKLSEIKGPRWHAVNDPKTVNLSVPKFVRGPNGTEWEDAVWEFPGHHRIVCEAFHDGKIHAFTYEQWVVPNTDLVDGPLLPTSEGDPDATLDGIRRAIGILQAINKAAPPQSEAGKEEFAKSLEAAEDFRDKLAERLKSTKFFRRHPIQAEHFEATTQKRFALRVFISKVAFDKWMIVDWTDPRNRAATGEYSGVGSTDLEAIQAAIKDWDEDNRYPAGAISFRIPDLNRLPALKGEFETDGTAFWDSVSSFFGWVGAGAAVVAGVITLLAPVPGSQVVSALIWTSIFSSTAAAAINIGTRIDEGFSSWQANAFDVLSIVGNLFGATGIVWSRGANVLLSQGNKVAKFALIGSVTTDGVQGVMLAAEQVKEFDAIQADKSLTPNQRMNRLVELFRSALVNGALFYVSVKGTKADLENLNTRSGLPGVPTPAEKLRDIGDASKTIDLTQPPKVEGKPGKDPHVTTVGTDQEMQPPHIKGQPVPAPRPKPKPKPGPQPTADLDALYAQAAVAKPELDALTVDLASRFGGEAKTTGLKKRPEAEAKIKRDYPDSSHITDLARSSLVFKKFEDLKKALDAIKAEARVVRIKDKFETPIDGYRDFNITLRASNGHVVEIQLQLEALLKIKDGGGHALYKKKQAIIDRAAAEKRRTTAAEDAEIESISAQMRKLYDDAFESTKGDKP